MLESTRHELRQLVYYGSTDPNLQIYRLRKVLDLKLLDLEDINGLSQHDGQRAITALRSL